MRREIQYEDRNDKQIVLAAVRRMDTLLVLILI